jgi:hypothetical protein
MRAYCNVWPFKVSHHTTTPVVAGERCGLDNPKALIKRDITFLVCDNEVKQ